MEPLSSLVLVNIHVQLCMYTFLEEQQNRKCEEKKQVGTNWSPCLWYWSASKICCKYSRAGVYTFFWRNSGTENVKTNWSPSIGVLDRVHICFLWG